MTAIVHTARQQWQDGRGKIVAAIATGWFLSIGVRLTYPVLLPYFQTTYGLTLSTAGVLLTVLWLAYAVGQLPGGLVADRIGEGTVMAVSMLVSAGTLTLVVVGGSTRLLFGATALFGLALSLFGTVRLSALAGVYPDQRGTAISLISAVGDIGNMVLPPVVGLIAAAVAWQVGLGAMIPFFVLAGIYIWVAVPRRTTASSESTSLSLAGIKTVLSAVRRPPVLLILFVQLFGYSVYHAFTGFYPVYLIQSKGVSPTVASGLFALFFALGVIVKPLSGRAFDRIGARQTLLVLMSVSGGGLLLLSFVESFGALIAVTAILSFMAGRGPLSLSYMTVSLPDPILNTGLGTLRTIYMTIGAGSPALFGLIAGAGYFDEAFVLLSAVSGLCLVFIWLLPPLE